MWAKIHQTSTMFQVSQAVRHVLCIVKQPSGKASIMSHFSRTPTYITSGPSYMGQLPPRLQMARKRMVKTGIRVFRES